MKEIWLPVPIAGYKTRYKVSNFGRMQSMGHTKKILKPKTYENDYIKVNMTKNAGKTKILRGVHRLVALAFIPNPQNKECINHKDNNPQNNHISNLEWVTHQENTDYKVLQGRHAHGETGGNAILKTSQVLEIRRLKHLSNKELGTRYGVHAATIHCVQIRKTWAHL